MADRRENIASKRSATDRINQPGSATGQFLGKTGADTYGGLVVIPGEDDIDDRDDPNDPKDEDDRDDRDDETDLEPKQRFPGEEADGELRALEDSG